MIKAINLLSRSNLTRASERPYFARLEVRPNVPESQTPCGEKAAYSLSVTRAKGFDNTDHILPGTSALYDVTITNESPYREGLSLGLVMATDDSYSGSVGGNTKDLSVTINGGAAIPAFGGMYSLNDVPSTDDNGDLVHSVMTLRVDKGAESNSYSGLALELVSECEYYLASAQLYRDPHQHGQRCPWWYRCSCVGTRLSSGDVVV